jgi:hypothetical protein
VTLELILFALASKSLIGLVRLIDFSLQLYLKFAKKKLGCVMGIAAEKQT